MALYAYIKDPPKTRLAFFKKRLTFRSIKILPYITFGLGIVLLLIVVWPMVSYQLLVFSKDKNRIISPVSESSLAEAKGLVNPLAGVVLSASQEKPKPEFADEVDYNLIQNWFPTASLPRLKPSKITHYSLSIPKLKIKDAVVAVGGQEVKKTLIHYPGTALPGEYGNTVIFGHSVLPVFYSPKDYKAIFSLLPTLKNKDEFYIYFDGIEYVYQVEDYFEVKPEDVQVLEQRFNEQTLSLITCVPPGTYLRRGVIKARLKNLQ